MKLIFPALILSILTHVYLAQVDMAFINSEQVKPTTMQTVSLTMETISQKKYLAKKKKVDPFSNVSQASIKRSTKPPSNHAAVSSSQFHIKHKIVKQKSHPPSAQQTKPFQQTAVTSIDPENKVLVSEPRYKYNPPPRYPIQARRRGYEGTVILKILVDTDGSVNRSKILKSSGYSILDSEAVRSVKKWIFEPGKKDIQVVTAWVKVPIRFRLN